MEDLEIRILKPYGAALFKNAAVHFPHPGKLVQLWINERSVTESNRGLGFYKRLMQTLFEQVVRCTFPLHQEERAA